MIETFQAGILIPEEAQVHVRIEVLDKDADEVAEELDNPTSTVHDQRKEAAKKLQAMRDALELSDDLQDVDYGLAVDPVDIVEAIEYESRPEALKQDGLHARIRLTETDPEHTVHPGNSGSLVYTEANPDTPEGALDIHPWRFIRDEPTPPERHDRPTLSDSWGRARDDTGKSIFELDQATVIQDYHNPALTDWIDTVRSDLQPVITAPETGDTRTLKYGSPAQFTFYVEYRPTRDELSDEIQYRE